METYYAGFSSSSWGEQLWTKAATQDTRLPQGTWSSLIFSTGTCASLLSDIICLFLINIMVKNNMLHPDSWIQIHQHAVNSFFQFSFMPLISDPMWKPGFRYNFHCWAWVKIKWKWRAYVIHWEYVWYLTVHWALACLPESTHLLIFRVDQGILAFLLPL